MVQNCTDNKNGNSTVQPTETSFTRAMTKTKSGSTVNLTNERGLNG